MSNDIFLKGSRPYLWIIGIGFLLYAQTLLFGFTNFDDDALIQNNYSTLHSFSKITQVFREDVFHNDPDSPHYYYRPMLILSFMLDAQLGGISPFRFHLTNILLHLLAACLLFVFLKKLKYKRALSLFLSLIFTVHPALTQAVAWVPGRNDSLLAVFALLAFISFLDFKETKKWSACLLHFLFFVLALFTKETAMMLPLLCLAYIYLIMKGKLFSANNLGLISGWLVVFAFWFSLRLAAVKTAIPLADVVRSSYLSLPAVLPYLGKIFFPFNLSAIPLLRDMTFDCGIAAFLFILNALIFTKERRNNFVAFGILWFLLFLLPSFICKGPSGEIIILIEHRIYLSLIGLCIVLLETDLLKRLDLTNMRSFLAGLQFILFFSLIAFNHSVIFKNGTGFWENVVRNSPHMTIAHWKLANHYARAGLADKAEIEYKRAIELNYWLRLAHNNLGCIYKEQNRLKEAKAEFEIEIKINPASNFAYINLGNIYYDRKNYKQAIYYYDEAIKRGGQVSPKILSAVQPYRK
ncbi:MAG: tetratricopeptide repeat protein [Candidatus Margulisiibacteriota bacterium]